MRLDHIAYRVLNRQKAVDFFVDFFNYTIQNEFEIKLEDGSKANCTALERKFDDSIDIDLPPSTILGLKLEIDCSYFKPPEIFVSSGPKGSLIYDWVTTHGQGIHHLAYEVDDVHKEWQKWKDLGIQFTSNEPFTCDDLIQIFTKPIPFTGLIYELIQRKTVGFCKDNVGKLMSSTKWI